jgi:hypothetical protein
MGGISAWQWVGLTEIVFDGVGAIFRREARMENELKPAISSGQ